MLPQGHCTRGEASPVMTRQLVIVTSAGSGSQTTMGRHHPPNRPFPPLARPALMADRKMGDTMPCSRIPVKLASQTSGCQASSTPVLLVHRYGTVFLGSD